MKRVIAVILACSLMLVGCGQTSSEKQEDSKKAENVEQEVLPEDLSVDAEPYEYVVDFETLDDADLQRYVRDNLYNEMVTQLNSDEYFIENISTVYISQEYIDELTYNSKPNIYFGYTLEDIDAVYQGMRYVFTLSEEGETVVVPFESYDDTFEQVIKNVAIGSGVILICVTVSLVTAGTGAPAVSMIFAVGAKTGTVCALSSGALGAVAAGITTGVETGDMDEALKAAALMGSESFKWGAITGTVSGGVTEFVALKGATLNGLTMNEAAIIQKESKYPLDVIKQFHCVEEYNVFKTANLKTVMINGKNALIRTDIDLDFVDEYGQTNLQRMMLGKAPLDKDGLSYELHHIGQEENGTLAILTQLEHNNAALHGYKATTVINRNAFGTIRKNFWKEMANILVEKG